MSSTIHISFVRNSTSRKRIVAAAVLCGLAGLVYAVLSPSWFRSTVAVVPAKPHKASVSSLLGAEVGALTAGLDVPLGGSADSARIAAVLQSNVVTDAVIAKFGLKSRYRQKYLEGTREMLWRHCNVKPLPKPNLVQLSCEDTDPRFVQEMLNYFASFGNEVFRRVGVGSASEEVRFLEGRVAELRQNAEDTAKHMREFQEKFQIVDLESQAKAVVSALATLQSQRISKQMELDFARTFSAGDESTLRQLESQLGVMDAKLRDLESPQPNAGFSPAKRQASAARATAGVFPAALEVPKLRAEYETLFRDRKVSETLLVLALERLESARADAARDVSTFLVLDPPVLPTRHARPYRLMIVIGCGLLGLVMQAVVESWRSGELQALVAASSSHARRSSAGTASDHVSKKT